jgi:hypothetical protein
VLTTLADVPLAVRMRGVREWIAEERPTIEERLGMFTAALWPSSETYRVADPEPALDRDEAIRRARELRRAGVSYAKAAAQIGVPRTTLMDWARRGML